mgnify:CR=1 FL=1
MTTLENYRPSFAETWSGRIDDLHDRDAFRIHQVVRRIDLRKIAHRSIHFSDQNICLLGFCCDEGIRRNLGRVGADQGPAYIRQELANLPVTFPDTFSIYDAGDIHCAGNDLERAQAALELAVERLMDHGLFPLVLGGGHELALGHYRGITQFLNKKHRHPPGIINFDAHLDLRPMRQSGSSGTMFSQIADDCRKSGFPFTYFCLGVQTTGNTISLFKRAEQLGAEYMLAREISAGGLAASERKIMQFIDRCDTIYLTLCCDVFHSHAAPGVSALQPFGMDPETVLQLIKIILNCGKTVAIDIAEVSPRFDRDHHTAKLVSVIIYAMINQLIN